MIPSRTCLQDQLRETFGDIALVNPSRQRSVLATFKGALDGTGVSVRRKIVCPRMRATTMIPRLEGGDLLPVYWNEYPPDMDYLATINNTIFCPLPRGTTGRLSIASEGA